MTNITAEEKLVLFLSQPNLPPEMVSAYLFRTKEQAIDFDKVLRMIKFNGVGPVIYCNIRNAGVIQNDFLNKLKGAYISTDMRNIFHLRETLRVLELLSAADIPVISLKGSLGSAILLGDPGCYPTSDIDILVPFEKRQQAGAVLLASGYNDAFPENELPGNYHRTYINKEFFLELHWNLVKQYFMIHPGFWWEDTRTIEFENRPILQLSHEKYLLYLIFRLFAHGFFPLRFFILINGLIRKEQLDWEKVWAASDKLRMNRLTLFTLKILSDFFDIHIPIANKYKKIFGYHFISKLILKGFFHREHRTYIRMIVYLSLLDRPIDMFTALIRKVFPVPAEICIRYNIPYGSLKIFFYYLMNPFLMLFRKTKRQIVE